MALIYTKLTEKTVVLAPRQGLARKFNFGTDWTEVRVGMYLTAISSSGSNVDNTTEALVPADISDFMIFGLKNDSPTALPGKLGGIFLGVRSGDAASVQSTINSGIGGSAGSWKVVGYYGTSEVLGAGVIAASRRIGAATGSAASAYCGFFALRFVITDRGLSSQSVSISMSVENSIAGTDYSATALRTAINNATYGGDTSIAWNDGATAREIPDCIWVRSPLYSNALRISALRAVRYAP